MTSGFHVIPDNIVMQLATPELAFECCIEAFKTVASGEAGSFPVLAGTGTDDTTRVNIKYGTVGNPARLGLKVGTFWPKNEAAGRPNHGATTLLLNAETGTPFALLNVSRLNRLRTAAADAVAVSTLARADAKILAIVGTGRQAEAEVRAVVPHRRFEEIRVIGRTTERALALANRLDDIGVPVVVSDIAALGGADVVMTVTNATEPVVMSHHVGPGTHISAMGADARGKQELDTALLFRAALFCDHPPQSLNIGEFQRLAQHDDRAAIAAIGDILSGKQQGREDDRQITIFDSSGVAAQDVVIAARIAHMAIAQGLSRQTEF
jgi:ornithine cyclodeaminase